MDLDGSASEGFGSEDGNRTPLGPLDMSGFAPSQTSSPVAAGDGWQSVDEASQPGMPSEPSGSGMPSEPSGPSEASDGGDGQWQSEEEVEKTEPPRKRGRPRKQTSHADQAVAAALCEVREVPARPSLAS